MKYFITDISLTAGSAEILSPATDLFKAFMAEIGYEAFEDDTDSSMISSLSLLKDFRKDHPNAPCSCFSAYVQQDVYDEESLSNLVSMLPFDDIQMFFETREAEDKNWNEKWESEQDQSETCKDLGIVIDVKQAFGTGGHFTTQMIATELKNSELKGKLILDCGCGSGILSIAALKLGAKSATGYDIDEWSVNNTRHNAELNGFSEEQLEVLLGDAGVLGRVGKFDFVLANINRNILLNDMPSFVEHINKGGKLILSGFYEEDAEMLIEKASSLDLSLERKNTSNNWCMLVFSL